MSSVFGQALRALREQHGMTQAQLATALGLKHQSHIAHLESPRGDADWPTLQLLSTIARHFAVPIDDLLLAPSGMGNHAAESLPPWPAEQIGFQLLGLKVRRLRTQQLWTLSELGMRLYADGAHRRYSRSYLSNVEAGRKLITVPVLIRLLLLFGVSGDYLLRDDLAVEPPILRSHV